MMLTNGGEQVIHYDCVMQVMLIYIAIMAMIGIRLKWQSFMRLHNPLKIIGILLFSYISVIYFIAWIDTFYDVPMLEHNNFKTYTRWWIGALVTYMTFLEWSNNGHPIEDNKFFNWFLKVTNGIKRIGH